MLYEFPTDLPLLVEQQFAWQVKFDLMWDGFFAHCIAFQAESLAMEQDEETNNQNEDLDEDSEIDKNDSEYIQDNVSSSHRQRAGVPCKHTEASNSSETFTCKQGTKDSCEGSNQKKKNLTYEFCPLPHQPSVLHLLTKHFCQHPLLPEQHGWHCTAEYIYRDSVHEMYLYCKNNHLCEVWGYLWTSWYTPDKWKLWAWSAHPHAIPRKRTTMVVESMWWNFKCLVLYLYNHPRVDFATFALVTQALPGYRHKLLRILNNPHKGWATTLHGKQIPIKKVWLLLCDRPINGEYITKVDKWTCSCGTQKFHSYLLCKHLVREVACPPPEWWATIVQCHTPPFYNVCKLLTTEAQAIAPEPEVLGNHSWLARMPDMSVGPNAPAVPALPVHIAYFWRINTDLYWVDTFLTFPIASHWCWQHATREQTQWFHTGK